MAKRKRVEAKNKESSHEKRVEKEVFFAHEQIAEFKRPPFSWQAQEECAVLLRRLEDGEKLEMPQSRPMPSIAGGCHELRVRDAEANWRLIYFLDVDAIVVLQIFAKKTPSTPQSVIELCRRRLKKYQAVRTQAEQLKKK